MLMSFLILLALLGSDDFNTREFAHSRLASMPSEYVWTKLSKAGGCTCTLEAELHRQLLVKQHYKSLCLSLRPKGWNTTDYPWIHVGWGLIGDPTLWLDAADKLVACDRQGPEFRSYREASRLCVLYMISCYTTPDEVQHWLDTAAAKEAQWWEYYRLKVDLRTYWGSKSLDRRQQWQR